MTYANPLRPDLDPDTQADLAHRFAAHHPDVSVNRARIGYHTTRIAVTAPELDPDEEPYGDAAWYPDAAEWEREAIAGNRIVAVASVVCGIGFVLLLAWLAGVAVRVFFPHS